MKYIFVPVLIALVIGLLFCNGVCCGVDHTCRTFSRGDRKVFTWSSIEQLNVELAKGYEVEYTYNITNMVLKKKESKAL
jgi:hypothetical protein